MTDKKVIRIIARLNIGGPAIHTILLSHELDKRGYKNILVKGSEGKTEGDMMYLARARGVEPVLVPELGREIGLKNDAIAFYKLYKLIKGEKPDIVHTHTAKAGTIGRLAAWLAGVPIIVHTFHGHVLKGYFGRLKSWTFIQIERILARMSTRLITLSNGLKKELIELGVGNEKKFAVIPLGLELKPFLENENNRGTFKKELGLSEKNLLVGIVGRLVPIKGHRYFLDMANRLLEEFRGQSLESENKSLKSGVKSTEIKFVIVGDGELRQELEENAKSLGIEEDVIFTGFRHDLKEVYADMDVLVLTSLNEGTPVSIIEAMASGKPVVANDVGGVSSLIKDNETGFLVKTHDGKALSEGVLKLMKDPDLRQKFGTNGRHSVFPKYDISHLVERIESLYSSLSAR
jgi:glycosyltransferase involved in cell wall biosynthesis